MKPEYINHLMKVDGKYYTVEHKDGRPYLSEVKKKEVIEKEKLVKGLTEELKDNLDREIVMKEALWNMRLVELRKLDKVVKSKIKYKPKTREGACADMKVGNFIIPIVD